MTIRYKLFLYPIPVRSVNLGRPFIMLVTSFQVLPMFVKRIILVCCIVESEDPALCEAAARADDDSQNKRR